MRRKASIITTALFLTVYFISSSVCAAGVSYLPDVTAEMSKYSYWTENDALIMTYEEIEELNSLTISTKGTYMCDLKNQPETTDGIALNEGINKSELDKSDQDADQVSDQVRALPECIDDELFAVQLMERLGLSHRPTFRKKYLHPALDMGLIEMTIPDKPNIRNQKYRRKT